MEMSEIEKTFTDPDGTVYEAVHQDDCKGCAFDGGPLTVGGMFSENCYSSPNCNASSNGGKSIIWVRKATKTFTVFVTRDITETAIIQVEAQTREMAEELAYDQRYEIRYETDDGIGQTYISECFESNAEEKAA